MHIEYRKHQNKNVEKSKCKVRIWPIKNWDNVANVRTMRHGYRTNHLFVGENMKKLLAFGIGGVWFGIFSSEMRRGLAVTSVPSSSHSPSSWDRKNYELPTRIPLLACRTLYTWSDREKSIVKHKIKPATIAGERDSPLTCWWVKRRRRRRLRGWVWVRRRGPRRTGGVAGRTTRSARGAGGDRALRTTLTHSPGTSPNRPSIDSKAEVQFEQGFYVSIIKKCF